MIHIENLTKRFADVVALQSVGLSVREGEIFGLLGPNGAGKTTLLNVLTGLVSPDDGVVQIDGRNAASHSLEVRRAIGYVPQEVAIYPDVSARDNVAFFGRLYGLSGGELKRAVDNALDFVGLADAAGRDPRVFSGGMKRRLNIACGIVHSPRLILLDEPTVGIDPQSRNHILTSVEELNRSGCTVVYTSHYMEEVERICSTIAILDHGKVIANGSLYELTSLITDANTYVFTLKNPAQIDEEALRAVNGVKTVAARDHQVTVTTELETYNIDELVTFFTSRGIILRGVSMDRPSLETVFLHLTGRTLRDEVAS
ncbi:MAG: ABC transporter ATP-binding protein [Spirochaetota bacterium]